MADSTTTNYGWTKPEVGGSSGSWGTKTNADWDSVDTTVKTVSDAADAAQTTADDAQISADTAIAGKLVLAPTTKTITGSVPSLAVSIDYAAGGPVYFVDIGTFNLTANSNLDVTFTNRPVATDRIVWLHVRIANVAAALHTLTIRMASASSSWVLPQGQALATGTTTVGVFPCTIAGDDITQIVIPVLIVGS